MSDQSRKETIRADVLEFLYDRQAVAHHPEAIRRGLNQGGVRDFTDEEVANALHFLCGMDHVEAQVTEYGATKYYQITAAGILSHERAN